jgi:PAS domain S-box-containing protein
MGEEHQHAILIVDDEPPIVAILRDLLQREGYRTIDATDGATALYLAQAHRPCLVLADGAMPGMSGIELCRRLKQNHATADIPVIMVSGVVDAAAIEAAESVGVVDYIKKPIDRDETRFRVRAQLRLRSTTRFAEREGAQLAAISRSARDAIVLMGSDGRIVHWNLAAESMFGYAAGEALDKNLHEMLAPQRFIEAHRKGMPEFVSGGGGAAVGRTLELAAVRRTGEEFPIELSLTSTKIEDQWYAVGIIRDITDRKRVEDAVRRSEEKHRALIELTDTGYLILDTAGRVLDANERYVSLTGHETLEQILGRSVLEWTAPDQRQANESAVKRCAEQGHISNFDVSYVDRDGGITPVEINAAVVGTGNTTRILSLCRDISERKRAEQVLVDSWVRFHAIYEGTSDAVMLLDENSFFDCNKATVHMFGCRDKAEFCTKHPADCSPPCQPDGRDSMTLANQKIATALAEGTSHFEWTHRRLDTGTDFPSEVLLARMELDGRHVLQATVRNVGECRHSERRLRDLLDRLPIGIAVVSCDGIVRFVNRELVSMAGRAGPEELIGRSCRGSICLSPPGQCPDVDSPRNAWQVEMLPLHEEGAHLPVMRIVREIELDGERVLLGGFVATSALEIDPDR